MTPSKSELFQRIVNHCMECGYAFDYKGLSDLEVRVPVPGHAPEEIVLAHNHRMLWIGVEDDAYPLATLPFDNVRLSVVAWSVQHGMAYVLLRYETPAEEQCVNVAQTPYKEYKNAS